VRALEAYAFPGNVRELENVVERAVTLATGPVIGLGDLPREVSGAASQPTPALVGLPEDGCNLEEVSARSSDAFSSRRSSASGGVRTQAAKLLGVTLR
jgi:two-component system response regulator PilR (NtrC family)